MTPSPSTAKPYSVGVAILTYNAEKLLPNSLPPLLSMQEKPRVLVVDSTSSDRTVALAKEYGAEVILVPKGSFNHGSTREMARKALGTDIAILMTHDAIAVDPGMVTRLVLPVREGRAVASYARQIPHDGAGFFERFPREFNYPPQSEVRGLEDVTRLGPYTFFCSDSCCAWLNAALDAIGGFRPTLSLEDTLAAARLIRAGYKIAYCADAVVKHSHHYSLKEELKRHFDTGYVRSENASLLFTCDGDERRGAVYVRAMFRQLIKERPADIPYAIAVICAKYLGYWLGKRGRTLPLWLKKRLTTQPNYF